MGCFFDCFRIKNVERSKFKDGRASNNQKAKAKGDRSPLKQLESEKLHHYASNEGIADEINNEISGQKSVSKNQLSAVFLREDLDDENSLEKIEDKQPATENKHEEKETPDTKQESTLRNPTNSNNSFVDKHILPHSPNSPLSNSDSIPTISTNTNTAPSIPGLAEWLKPPNQDRPRPGLSGEELDRPIIGSVAAHWSQSEEESESVTAQPVVKTWDGKGIPNSTNKYKEDQKVSWHATPFEERLEKALSEEKFLSQRGFSGGIPFEINTEGEESDTAAS